VEHGRTGLIVRDAQEMAEAIHAATRIDPEACRAAARERFPLERTVKRYFALYRVLAQRGWAETDSAERSPRHLVAADAFPGD
jgi:glycosyltransferase involved in cell wall biosynthesis